MQNTGATSKALGIAPRVEGGKASQWPQELILGYPLVLCGSFSQIMISPPCESTRRARLKPVPCRFPLQTSSKFFSHHHGRAAVGPHITGTGWRQIHGSTYGTAAAGRNRDEKPWEKKQVWGLQHPHLCLTKELPYLQEILVQPEHPAWKVKCDPRSVGESGHQGLCSQLFHHLWRAQQTLKTIWDVTRKWDNDAFSNQL